MILRVSAERLYSAEKGRYIERIMSHFEREVQLSSGCRWPLSSVASSLGLLTSYLEDDSPEIRGLVYSLRSLCLGQPLSEEQKNSLREQKLLSAADDVSPVLKDVVLTSVRGEDHALYLVSPFTNHWDRGLSDYLHGRDRILAKLDPRQAAKVLKGNTLQGSFDAPSTLDQSEQKAWTKRTKPKSRDRDAPSRD
jgi:hypothetical protein